MTSSIYVEDLFIEFSRLVDAGQLRVLHQDTLPIYSFSNILVAGNSLTQSQSNLTLKILNRYRSQLTSLVDNVESILETPTWKTPFRIIDLTKRVWVEVDPDGAILVCLKFPYHLKKAFDDAFSDNHSSWWDPEQKVRKLPFYKYNPVQIEEFVRNNGFEIDETFDEILSQVEEIWQNQEYVEPKSVIKDGMVFLQNASEEIIEWWDQNKTGNLNSDLVLAKSMGYCLINSPTTTIEKIAAAKSSVFWIKNISDFLEISKEVNGKVCVILDRAGKSLDWLQEFDLEVLKSGIPKEQIKVCFRADKGQDQSLNEWIRTKGYGGAVEEGKILIFNHKPAKWLFKDQNNVTILASNNLYHPTNVLARDWFNSHPCKIYVGDIKPSLSKETKIVEL